MIGTLRHNKRSLSARLIWIFLIMAVLLVVLVGGTMGIAFKHGFEDRLRPHLVRYLEYVQADIGSPPDLQKAQALTERLPLEIHVFSSGASWSSTGMPPDLASMEYRHDFEQNGVRYRVAEYQGQEYLISHHTDHTLAFSIPDTRGPLHWRLLVPIAILLLVLILLHHAIRKLFQPIDTLKSGLQRIGEGELGHRVDIRRRDELGELATSINAMAGEIQRMLETKRMLLLAISHELRSPVTRAKVSLEMLEDADQRMELNRELNEIEELITDLLETERLSSGHHVLNKSVVPLNQLMRDLIHEQFSVTTVDLKLPEGDLVVNIDVTRITLLLKNLIDNAVRHNSNSVKAPMVVCTKENTGIRITVTDFGKGISEQHLPYLTEPFYRVDPARQRSTGGYGIGLYLCRMIAEAHEGTLEIRSEMGEGTEVEVHLPIEHTPGVNT